VSAETALAPVIIAGAFFGEAVFGFGGGLISVTLLSVLLGVRDAVTLVLLFQFCMGLLLWKAYPHINWQTAKPMAVPAAIGTLVGTLLLSHVSTPFLQLFLAVSILVFLVKTVWFQGFTLGHKRNSAVAAAAGLGGGIVTGLIGTGGPIVIMYLMVAIKDRLSVRATFIWLFFVIGIVRLCISIPQHLFTAHIMRLALVSAPFFFVAILVGQHVHRKVSERYYRLSVNVILLLSAIVLVMKVLDA